MKNKILHRIEDTQSVIDFTDCLIIIKDKGSLDFRKFIGNVRGLYYLSAGTKRQKQKAIIAIEEWLNAK